ncbi:uncharacterized protein VTP21DRAFT_836 [Calcarisporiella thermophila]|uniref:uncharacterized protein n=1 Tax=Calcarisporiella thermophila TaxID=911321 RepID=UPI003743A4D6
MDPYRPPPGYPNYAPPPVLPIPPYGRPPIPFVQPPLHPVGSAYPPAAGIPPPAGVRPPPPMPLATGPVNAPQNQATGSPAADPGLTTLFVGAIPAGISDEFIERMLKACGLLTSWKRVMDQAGNPKGFGFAVFGDADGVLRALRVLAGGESTINPEGITLPALDGSGVEKKLIVKVDDNVRRHLDEHEAQKTKTPNDESLDRTALEMVQGFVKDLRSEQTSSAPANSQPPAPNTPSAPHSVERRGQEQEIPPDLPPEQREMIDREISFFRELSSKHETDRRTRSRSRDRRSRSRSAKSPTPSTEVRFVKGGHLGDERREEKKLPEVDEEEEEERRRTERFQRNLELAFKERERRWEKRESARARQYEREDQREREVSERESRVRDDMAKRFAEWRDDEEEERGKEEYYRNRERWYQRRRVARAREEEWDEKDRAREQEEIQEERRRLEEERRKLVVEMEEELTPLVESISKAGGGTKWTDVGVNGRTKGVEAGGTRGRDEQKDERRKWDLQPAASGESRRNGEDAQTGARGPAQAQAQSAAAKLKFSLGGASGAKRRTGSTPAGGTSGGSGSSGVPATGPATPLGFGEEDEEDSGKKKRLFVPLVYSDDEGDSNEGKSKSGEGRPSARDEEQAERRRQQVKKLVDSIPADRDGLWRWDIKWEQLDDTMVEQKLRPFVTKKIVDMLGETVEDLVKLILRRIRQRKKPGDLLSELKEPLDDEAEMFVMKLWRMLIFETEARAKGIQV